MGEEPFIPEQEQEQENIEDLNKVLADEKARSEEYLASLQRSEADFRNYKKRIEQEKRDSLAWSNAEFIKSLLPVLDDMERAFSMMEQEGNNSSWVEGFRIIQRKLQDVLKANGCTEIECVGLTFDPNLHEAIAYEDGKEGTVISEHRKGYTMKNTVLRASQVTVGSGKNGNETGG
ncbi:MAG: nucleotide exchange factor GrpE [Dehalococcoidia bacterium]|nr:nucleotide exchange factor GrpE [Dehalococcoidia bacterium]